MNKNILIIGKDSQLGNQIHKLHSLKKDIVYSSVKSLNAIKKNDNVFVLNLTNPNPNIFKKFIKIKFDIVYFFSAKTPRAVKDNIEKKSYFGNLSELEFSKYLITNCFGPLKIFEYLMNYKLIKNNSKVIFISSLAGSIDARGKMKHNVRGGNIIYRISKSALNCAVKNLSYDYNKTKLAIVALHPGWVKTNKTGNKADLSIEYSIKKIFNTVHKLSHEDSGKFIDLDGKKISW